jgi:hypothetical protein
MSFWTGKVAKGTASLDSEEYWYRRFLLVPWMPLAAGRLDVDADGAVFSENELMILIHRPMVIRLDYLWTRAWLRMHTLIELWNLLK